MKNIVRFINLEKIFYGMLMIAFIGIIFMAFKSLISYPGGLICMGLLLVIIIFLFVIIKKSKFENNKYYLYMLIISLLALAIKILNIIFISSSIVQISDFSVHLGNAISNVKDFSNVVHFYHWALLSKTFELFSIIFGKTELGAIIFISFISIISVVLIYILTFLITKKVKVSFISSLIYMMWPANILYTNIFSTEHIAIMLILLIFILFIYFEETCEKRNYFLNITLVTIIGICLGVLKFFKPVSIIIIIAIIIYYIFYKLIYKKTLKINLYKSIYIVGIIISYFITSMCIFNYLDTLANTKVNRNPTAFYIYMGLSPNNSNLGGYSDYVVQKYGDYYLLFDHNLEKVDNQLVLDLRNEYKNIELYKVSNILLNKYKVTWRQDLSSLYWVRDSIYDSDKLLIDKNILLSYGTALSQAYYFLILCLYFIGNYACFKNSKKEPYLLIVNLFVFGVLLLLLISETQGRYKIITYPFIAIVATYGLAFINRKIKIGGNL